MKDSGNPWIRLGQPKTRPGEEFYRNRWQHD
jgi:hypothetical protein